MQIPMIALHQRRDNVPQCEYARVPEIAALRDSGPGAAGPSAEIFAAAGANFLSASPDFVRKGT
ncbi:protein of unknown function [Burkholderia multivorans]